MKKLKHKLLFEPVYGASVDFVWNCSGKELETYLDIKYDYVYDDDASSCGGAVTRVTSNGSDKFKAGHPVYVIWLSKKDEDYLDHEVMHLAGSILGDCGVKFSPDNDEHYVYYKTFWMVNLREIWKNKHKKCGQKPTK